MKEPIIGDEKKYANTLFLSLRADITPPPPTVYVVIGVSSATLHVRQ